MMNAPVVSATIPGLPARTARARLAFESRGGLTVLARQFVPYPFHVTRPFHLDTGRRDLATLYLQSSSGGLFRGDDLALSITACAGAAAWVTTQAATIVHDTRGEPARQSITVEAGPQALLVLACDPLVLFPGAELETSTRVTLAPGARIVVAEGMTWYDPGATGRVFESYRGETTVTTGLGRVVVMDRQALAGAEAAGPFSPLGPYRAMGSVLLLGEGPWPDPAGLESLLDGLRCWAGASALPGRAGLGLRVLAPDGGALAAGLDAVVMAAMEQVLGVPAARRRK
jgi:urease accessory protein